MTAQKRKATQRQKPKPRRAKAASKKKSDLLTRRELATALSAGRPQPLHPMTITKWEQDGMPVAQRGGKGRPSHYRELEVRAWLQLRDEQAKQPGAISVAQSRARREQAQAALAEQAYKIRMRELLPREEVEQAWADEVSAVRTKMLLWPTTLAHQIQRIAVSDGVAGVEQFLQEKVRDVLRELSSPDRPVPGASPPAAT